MPSPRLREDGGFTLVEMMVAAVILSIVVAPLTASVLLGLLTVTQSQSRVTHSADEQLVASYFNTDVQSATTAGTGAYCSGGGAELVLAWTDPKTTQSRQVAYVVSGAELTRIVCVDGSETRRLPVATSLTSSAPVTVQCAQTPPTFAACTTSDPRQVRISITEAGETFQADDYTFSLTATRRVGS